MNSEIRKLNWPIIHLLPYEHQPFDVAGRFIPIYDGEKWSYREILYKESDRKNTGMTQSIQRITLTVTGRQSFWLSVMICVLVRFGLARAGVGMALLRIWQLIYSIAVKDLEKS